MRLLNIRTFILETFHDSTIIPRYAILSHTWEEEEVLFEDVTNQPHSVWMQKKGASKVIASCRQALRDDSAYIWIDTCCIEKSSSAELSEAINSMFRWYQEAAICYAYLSDATDNHGKCRWYSRGWTLQELIAPPILNFYNKDWKFVGTRHSDALLISKITGIDTRLLCRTTNIRDALSSFSIATKMYWASRRSTTKEEDRAYCLMGLFDVHMPLLYGEGHKAFQRLQEEVLRNTKDNSILAFHSTARDNSSGWGILASGAESFHWDLPLTQSSISQSRIRIDGDELHLEGVICPLRLKDSNRTDLYMLRLDCRFADALSMPALILERIPGSSRFRRRSSGLTRLVPHEPFLRLGDNSRPTHYMPHLELAKRQEVVIAQPQTHLEVPFSRNLNLRTLTQDEGLDFCLSHSVDSQSDTHLLHLERDTPFSGTFGGLAAFVGGSGVCFFLDWASTKIFDSSTGQPVRKHWCFIRSLREQRILSMLQSPEHGLPPLSEYLKQVFGGRNPLYKRILDLDAPDQHDISGTVVDGAYLVNAEVTSDELLSDIVFHLDVVIQRTRSSS
ncbi:hypothetical protein JX266_009877 [Neoarthrinium moseri]|nr:hypothetical protein JX266_009877 [Neoarthrinium moseri]